MNKKGSMELSVNSIVILVIAVTLLGLILGFITTKMKEVKIPQTAPEASPASPSDVVTVSSNPFAANSGKNMPIMVNFYNSGEKSVKEVTPVITCGTDVTVMPSFNPESEIKVAESRSFIGLVKVTASLESHLCKIEIKGKIDTATTLSVLASKDFVIKVE